MPERSTRTLSVRVGTPLEVGPVTLVPIERIVTHADRWKERAWFLVCKEPYAIVVRDAAGVRAVGTDAVALSLDRLREEVPELDAVLGAI